MKKWSDKRRRCTYAAIGTAEWWRGAAGACGHSSQGRRHASCSNCNWGSGRQHECRGPARELLWPDTAERGGRCRVICRGECCSRLSNVFLAQGHCGLGICVCSRSSTIYRSSISAGREAQNCSQRANVVAIHSDLNQAIFIN